MTCSVYLSGCRFNRNVAAYVTMPRRKRRVEKRDSGCHSEVGVVSLHLIIVMYYMWYYSTRLHGLQLPMHVRHTIEVAIIATLFLF